MKKASRIVLIVGGATALFVALSYLIVGIVFSSLSSPSNQDQFVQAINDGRLTVSIEGTPEEKATFARTVLGVLAVVFYVFTAIEVITGVFALATNNTNSKALLIVNIILGAISFTIVPIVGAILGLVALNRQNNQAV